ncbi:hypothetical protein [Streptoalloteichus hindustanus]|uniref:Uncharacterized protein n=1 Tax=Streptoalloteichus hindustanus TaxID=2017 RepID=A0A1M4XSS9_STRHI|nr:hypothetical protein [Streptoalloteichus hindustanus]SHE96617.1 hypothetical protein SAMN05444320_102112 [Streptoalloteichus hindustanus]
METPDAQGDSETEFFSTTITDVIDVFRVGLRALLDRGAISERHVLRVCPPAFW